MSQSDNIIVETTDRIFRDLADPQTISNAADDGWKQNLWRALEDSGLTLAWVPDDMGGAGAGIADGFDILHTAGSHAVAVPLAETLLAGWLLSEGGLPSPSGPMTIALGAITLADGILSGRADAVPFAAESAHMAILTESADGRRVALVDTSACTVAAGLNIAGDDVASVTFDGVKPVAVGGVSNSLAAEDVMLMGAAARAQQMAGALQTTLDIAVAYAHERKAFGRAIAKFQAVQQNLARLAGEAAAAAAAAGSAADALHHADNFDAAVFLEVAAAKIRAGVAAGAGAAIAHQALGAIGFTDEHIMHRFTRRLWAWRDDFGSESEWAVGLGALVAAGGADDLWPLVASR